MSKIEEALKKYNNKQKVATESSKFAKSAKSAPPTLEERYPALTSVINEEYEKLLTEEGQANLISIIKSNGGKQWKLRTFVTNSKMYKEVADGGDKQVTRSLNEIEGFENSTLYFENGSEYVDIPFHMIGLHLVTLGLLTPTQSVTRLMVRYKKPSRWFSFLNW